MSRLLKIAGALLDPAAVPIDLLRRYECAKATGAAADELRSLELELLREAGTHLVFKNSRRATVGAPVAPMALQALASRRAV